MKRNMTTLIIPIAVALFNILIIFFPGEVMGAAKNGAILWFNNVLPSLLPFFIGTNILIGLGAVDFLGVLLEPAMRPLFGVPGCGGFALAMGMTSGYPVGAKVTGNLRESEIISKTEAQRLMAFVNNSGPLFMVGAVGTGMFASRQAGYFILLTNFLAALLTGLLFKFYKYEKPEPARRKQKRIFRKAYVAMENARVKDGRPFGRILSDSVWKAMEGVLQVAGFIILFSVLIKIVESTGAIDGLAGLLHSAGIGGGENLKNAVFGFIEVTNGAGKMASLGLNRNSLILCSGLISFGGLSIFAQSMAFLSKTDVKASIYFISKIINAVFTGVIGVFLYPLFDFTKFAGMEAAPVFAVNPMNQLVVSTIIYGMVLLAILITALAINVSYYIKANVRGR